MRSCGEAVESRSHKVAECKIYKEERDVVGEIWKIDKCDMEKFGTLDSSDKTIAILGDRRWPQTAKQEGHKKLDNFCVGVENLNSVQGA